MSKKSGSPIMVEHNRRDSIHMSDENQSSCAYRHTGPMTGPLTEVEHDCMLNTADV